MLKVDIPGRKFPQNEKIAPPSVETPTTPDDVFEAPVTSQQQKPAETPQQQVQVVGFPQNARLISIIQTPIGGISPGGPLQTPNLKMATPSMYLNSRFLYGGFPAQQQQETSQAEQVSSSGQQNSVGAKNSVTSSNKGQVGEMFVGNHRGSHGNRGSRGNFNGSHGHRGNYGSHGNRGNRVYYGNGIYFTHYHGNHGNPNYGNHNSY